MSSLRILDNIDHVMVNTFHGQMLSKLFVTIYTC